MIGSKDSDSVKSLLFFPPELSSEVSSQSIDGPFSGRNHLMHRMYFQKIRSTTKDSRLDRELVSLVLEEARHVISHPSKPTTRQLSSWSTNPLSELALDETLEDNPGLELGGEFLVELEEEKSFQSVAILDTSASMSGEKHLLASIAVAVLFFELKAFDTSLVVFNSEATTIKKLYVDEPCENTVLRFLSVNPRGFTNIEAGLREGLKQLKVGHGRKLAIIATDGRSTEGGDSLTAASQFDYLVVLHLHGPGSHLEASQEIALKGNGICLEVKNFKDLPRRLYEAVHTLSRR